MIDEDAAKRVESWIKAARKGGATLLAGGARKGNMLPATLLENVPHDADLYRKEAFGPVAGMESFDDFDDALARVNDSDFGLQAGVFTGRLAHAMRAWRSEEHTSELQSLMRLSYAVFCLKKKK